MKHPVPLRLACLAWPLFLGLNVARADQAEIDLGREVFLTISEPDCALCHTLADAGSKGKVGPSLDDLMPDADRVRKAVTEGVGVMPPNEVLTAEQIEAVARYVSTVAGKN
ncbi:c-type cytochrome [Aestuariivirga sp.]|uniref:SorU family sulfite dehydrogenase c-type cytochrome subunit n=1 Tax=Aestuariivirga sp. TaxID=2650926 RepID=UPI003919027D